MSDNDSVPSPRPRGIKEVLAARPTIEGAGVHLHRAFGAAEVPRLDPFLLLDDFRSENPAEYVAGFPWHPHRGIETVTYMLDGRVEHEDSLGNKGIIGSGDVQWMTSGSGIIHQEMPKVDRQRMGGFQLWVNLPKTNKMMDPRYQEVKADHTVFAYLLEGRASFDEEASDLIEDGHLVIFDKGDSVRVKTRNAATRLLLVSGRPLNEPIAWWGPIVMNNRKEIEQAVEEFQNGTFIKRGTRA